MSSDEQYPSEESLERPVPVSSASSLDSFIMELPDTSSSAMTRLQQNNAQDESESFDQTSQAMTAGSVLTTPDGVMVPSTAAANASIPEFLYQLTRMLTDDNREIIEWSNGKIEVHNPHKLETHVLARYFRHSKFASFQRQLNYFGFRKLAGKGKMAPCSYVNDSATGDLSSLLVIKRKTTPAPPSKEKGARKKERAKKAAAKAAPSAQVNPVLAGILQRNKASFAPLVTSHKPPSSIPAPSGSHQALAQAAVGRGVRHGYSAANVSSAKRPESTTSSTAAASNVNFETNDSLSQLAYNYRNSLNDLSENKLLDDSNVDSSQYNEGYSFLSRNSSLVDLAMIPSVDDGNEDPQDFGLSFVDFPNPEVLPGNNQEGE